jgi:uncharacterized lipoprotein YbaY
MQLFGDVRIIPEVGDSIVHANVHVRLLDVSRADASSETVASVVVENVSLIPGQTVGFVLDVGDLDTRHTYSLAAHVDLDGSQEYTIGDYLTMEHFDVSPDTVGEFHSVLCRRID